MRINCETEPLDMWHEFLEWGFGQRRWNFKLCYQTSIQLLTVIRAITSILEFCIQVHEDRESVFKEVATIFTPAY